MADVQSGGLFDRAVLLQLSTGRFSTKRKIKDLGAVHVDAAADGSTTDKSRIDIAAEILESVELDAIFSFDGATRRYLVGRALPVALLAPGVYVMPVVSVSEIDAYLSRRGEERGPLVAAFLDVYESRAADGRAALARLGDPAAYPPIDVVAGAFRMGFAWFSMGAPGGLAAIRADLYARESDKLAASFAEALDEARTALRTMAAGLVDHLLDKLSPDVTGKRKRFEESTVVKLIEWCGSFDARNLGDDGALAAEVSKIRLLLSGVSARELRGSEFARRDVSGRLSEVKTVLDGLLRDAPARFFPASDAAGA
jgi:hypothetical protein